MFRGPVGTKITNGLLINEHVRGASGLEKELWKNVVEMVPYGWRAVHFAVLDFYREKYGFDNMDIIHHGTHELPGEPQKLVFETTLEGVWIPKKWLSDQ